MSIKETQECGKKGDSSTEGRRLGRASEGPSGLGRHRLWHAGMLTLCCGGLAAFVSAAPVLALRESASPYANLATLARVLSHIELSWVGEVDQDALIEGAIRGMVSSLDPHSSYLSAEEYRLYGSDTEGRFAGVGVEIEVRDGWITVLSAFDGAPASAAGVRPGDRFLSIAGRPARDMRVEEAVRLMRGEPGTTVAVQLRREGQPDALVLNLRRAMVEIDPVTAAAMPDRMAYIRVRSFQRGAAAEVSNALDEVIAEQGTVAGVVLDLRDNPGGLLDEAVFLCDQFLSTGTIVTTRGRSDDNILFEARAHRSGTRGDMAVVVLVNQLSASAAEIVAGAFQDHERALIVGRRTFGKGSVQNVIELPDGSAVKLTIARYFTPSGRSLQARGILPDLEIPAPSAENPVRAGVSEAELPRHLDGGAASTQPPERSPARQVLVDQVRSAVWPLEIVESGPSLLSDEDVAVAFGALRWILAQQQDPSAGSTKSN